MPSLKRAVKVDADAVASDSRVLVREREHEGRVVPEAHAALADAEAALGLAEEHHVRRQREVLVVLKRVATQQLRRLGHTVTTGLPEEKMDRQF